MARRKTKAIEKKRLYVTAKSHSKIKRLARLAGMTAQGFADRLIDDEFKRRATE